MFPKLACLLVLTAVSSLVSALSLNTPQTVTSEGTVTISWTAQSGDQPFSLYLAHENFHDSYAIANNVDPAQNSITLTIPPVPAGSGYSLRAVNVTDINDVYSTSASFSIGTATQSTSSSVAATATSGGVSSTGTSVRPTTTATATSTVPASGTASGTGTATTSGTASAPNSSNTATDSGARSIKVDSGFVAAALAGAIAAAVAL